MRGDVPGRVLVDEWGAFGHRLLDVDDDRQRLVLDVDQLEGVLGKVAALGDDHRDRLADV